MAILGGRPACGKTTELIKMASEEQLYIVCLNRHRVKHIANMAREMKLDIPFPVTVDELPLKSPFIKEVLVDDLEDVLSHLVGKPIRQMTTSWDLHKL